MESPFLISTKGLPSLLGDPCPGCFQPSVLSRRFTELESTGLMGMYHNCRKVKVHTARRNWGQKSLLEGESGNYNVTESFLLDLHTASLHLFALKWSLLPLHSSHWHNILCAILNLHKLNVHLMHLSTSYCEKTNTPKPKQTRLCKQISSSSARKSSLFLLTVIDRLLQRWWLYVKCSTNISWPG